MVKGLKVAKNYETYEERTRLSSKQTSGRILHSLPSDSSVRVTVNR